MLIKVRKTNIYESIICFLMIYFTTKLFWDNTIPVVFEGISLGIIVIGMFLFFISLRKASGFTLLLIGIYFIYVIYILTNAFLKDTSEQLGRAIYEYIIYSFVFFSSMYLLKYSLIEKSLKVVFKIGVVVAILSWYEYLTKSYIIGMFGSTILYEGNYGFRAAVFSRSYLSHGMILGFFSIIATHLYYSNKNRRLLIASAFIYISIVTTSSRGPLVACGVALLYMHLLNSFIDNRYSYKKYFTIITMITTIIIIMCILLSDFYTSNETINYFLHRIRSIINWTGDAGNVGRISLWRRSIGWYMENVYFGIGPSKTGSWGTGSLGITESGVLKRLCELGVVGFILHYSIVGMIMFRAIKKYPKFSNNTKQHFIFYSALIIAILIDDITLQVTEEIMIAFFMWFSLAGINLIIHNN